jgi:PHD/YefM family antitoxin component YafN of YafNO toxin-antitoxin module
MTRQTTQEAPDRIVEDIERVERTGDPVAFERDGQAVAVLVSAADFVLLERLRRSEEDRLDSTTKPPTGRSPSPGPSPGRR